MNRSPRTVLLAIAGACALLTAPPSFAQATWNFDANGPDNCTNKGPADATASDVKCDPSVGVPLLKITDWFVDGLGLLVTNDFDPAQGVVVTGGSTNTGGTGGGGLGVKTDKEDKTENVPQNTYLDNRAIIDGDKTVPSTEALLFQFAASVVLSKVIGSWPATAAFPGFSPSASTSEITVLRYVGTETDPNKFIKDRTMAELVSTSGPADRRWELVRVGSLFGSGGLNLGTSITQSSSWWLISAYNSNYGGGSGFSDGNDIVRIFEIQASRISTPSSMALAALALGGLAFTQRRSAARRAA